MPDDRSALRKWPLFGESCPGLTGKLAAFRHTPTAPYAPIGGQVHVRRSGFFRSPGPSRPPECAASVREVEGAREIAGPTAPSVLSCPLRIRPGKAENRLLRPVPSQLPRSPRRSLPAPDEPPRTGAAPPEEGTTDGRTHRTAAPRPQTPAPGPPRRRARHRDRARHPHPGPAGRRLHHPRPRGGPAGPGHRRRRRRPRRPGPRPRPSRGLERHGRHRRPRHRPGARRRRPLPHRLRHQDLRRHRPPPAPGRAADRPRRHRRPAPPRPRRRTRPRRHRDHPAPAPQPHQRHQQLHRRPRVPAQGLRREIPRPPLRHLEARTARRRRHAPRPGLRPRHLLELLQHQLHPRRDGHREGDRPRLGEGGRAPHPAPPRPARHQRPPAPIRTCPARPAAPTPSSATRTANTPTTSPS